MFLLGVDVLSVCGVEESWACSKIVEPYLSPLVAAGPYFTLVAAGPYFTTHPRVLEVEEHGLAFFEFYCVSSHAACSCSVRVVSMQDRMMRGAPLANVICISYKKPMLGLRWS